MKIFDVNVNYAEDDDNLVGYEIELSLGNTTFNSYFRAPKGDDTNMHESICKGIQKSICNLIHAHVNHFCRKVNESKDSINNES